jgi:hypothetical protein
MSAHVGSPLPWSKAWSRANWDEARAPDRPGGGCPVCALTSGVPCQPGCQRRVRPAPRATPGLKGARGRGRGSPTARGGAARAGGSPLRPQAADSPARVARLAARGRDAGGTPGRPPGAPPRAHARSVASGMGLARRRVCPVGGARELPRRRKAHPARTRGASFPAPGSWGRGSIARKSTARVHVGRAFWHPGAGGGAARRKLRPMCTRGMRLLTYDRPAVAFPQLKGNRNPDFARNPTSCVRTGWGFWPGRALDVGWHLGTCQPP